MVNEQRLLRFKDAIWAGTSEDIVVLGAGGISSWLALFLTRTGNHNIYIYDDDDFDEVNLAGQFVRTSQIGVSKVIAVSKNCYEFSNRSLTPMRRRYDSNGMVSKIMFCGPDNMEARKVMFERWKSQFENKVDENNQPIIPGKYEYILIEARLLAEQYQVYYVTPDRIDKYAQTLFSDADVANESCTFKSTSHFAAMTACKMVQGFTAFLANRKLNDDIYELPFSYKELGPTFTNEIDYE